MPVSAAASALSALSGDQAQALKDKDHQKSVASAAKKFEGVLLQQLLSVMWKTAPGMDSSSGKMYQEMFQSSLADSLADSGGIGLAKMMTRALGGDASASAEADAASIGTIRRMQPSAMSAATAAPAFNEPGVGETAQLQAAASDMLHDGGQRWSKDGTLLPQDLQSNFMTDTAGGQARFSVRDANGYQGYYKCNLFALELGRRAGFEVPVVPRESGWGYPLAGTIANDAADHKLEGNWAKVATGESASNLDAAASSGQRAFMLAGSGVGDSHGHMAVVERVRSVDYGSDGAVRRIVFDGWEAKPNGAAHLTSRTWNVAGNPGGQQARDGFERIEILELKRPGTAAAGGQTEVPLAAMAKPSALDDSPSSEAVFRPKSGSEDDS